MQRAIRLIPTGCSSLDRLLNGGLHPSSVVLVYGEAETGKTGLAIQCAVNATRLDLKTIFIDSDGMFSSQRLAQIAGHDLNEAASKITLVKPETLEEQGLAIDRLDEYLTSQVGLIAVDTITSLYRENMDIRKERTFKLNRELGRQLACLAQVAKTRKITVLITSQVRSVLSEGYANLEPVATRVLRFWSDTIINLKLTDRRNVLKAVLERHVGRTCPVACQFSIEENGISDRR